MLIHHQDFDHETERMTINILSALSRFENVDDIPQEMMLDILMNKALRQRMSSEQDINQQIELVKETFIEESNKVVEQLETTKKEKALLNEEVETLEEKLKKTEINQSCLEERLKQLEHETKKKEIIQEAVNQRKSFAIKLLITTFILILFGFFIRYFISELLKNIVAWGFLIILWIWLIDKYGSENSTIKDQPHFNLFHKLNKGIIYIFGSVLASILAYIVILIWQQK